MEKKRGEKKGTGYFMEREHYIQKYVKRHPGNSIAGPGESTSLVQWGAGEVM